MTKGNVLRISRKIGSSPNWEILYLAGEEISSITTRSEDKVEHVTVHFKDVNRLPLNLADKSITFSVETQPKNYQSVMSYIKNLGQFPVMGKKQEDKNPLVV